MEIRPKGGVTWLFDGGTVTSSWQSAKSMMAIFLRSKTGGEASPSRLVRLVERGDVNATMQLIHNRADLNEEDISRAVEMHQTDIARLLIERGANVDAEDNYSRPVLSRAIELHQTGIARLLIERGANVDAEHGAVPSAAQDMKDYPCQTPTTSRGGRMILKNITTSSIHVDIHTTDTGRHIQYYRGVSITGERIPDTDGDFPL